MEKATSEFYQVGTPRKTLLVAAALSILLHGSVWYWFHAVRIQTAPPSRDRLIPRVFRVDRVSIDPKLLTAPEQESSEEPGTHRTQADVKIEVPSEQTMFEEQMKEIRAAPGVPDIKKRILDDKPRVEQTNLRDTISDIQQDSARAVHDDLDSLRKQLISDKPKVAGRPLVELAGKETGAKSDIKIPSNAKAQLQGESAGPRVGLPGGFSDLDALLARTGSLSGSKPILMPTDLLFDYDKYELRSQAVSSLQKLGQLIQRHPDARFTIEGHTDSFGSDEYNQFLSEHRAISVKEWLVTTMRIDPNKIQTRGFGKTRLLVPATGTVEEQQLNRRVEIVIKTSKS